VLLLVLVVGLRLRDVLPAVVPDEEELYELAVEHKLSGLTCAEGTFTTEVIWLIE